MKHFNHISTQLFVPEKIKVGFQKRDDTYTKRLAYVTYYDAKGKLRKETSWEGWRDHKIAPEEFENKPHSGFILNKDVKRSSDWFGDGHNMIRIYDDRGIEFEITTGNLIFILMTTNCHKRGLEGDFVYAWQGKDLILLPTGCEQYQACTDFTKLQSQKVSAKTLVNGGSYKTKDQRNLTFLGKFDYFTFAYPKRNSPEAEANKRAQEMASRRGRSNYGYSKYYQVSSGNKLFVFINDHGRLEAMSSISSLAAVNNETPVSNYAELVDKFYKTRYGSKVVNVMLKEKPMKFQKPSWNGDREDEVKGYYYVKNDDGTYTSYSFSEERTSGKYVGNKYVSEHIGYRPSVHGQYGFEDGMLYLSNTHYEDSEAIKSKYFKKKTYTRSELESMVWYELYVVLESGKKYTVEQFSSWSSDDQQLVKTNVKEEEFDDEEEYA